MSEKVVIERHRLKRAQSLILELEKEFDTLPLNVIKGKLALIAVSLN